MSARVERSGAELASLACAMLARESAALVGTVVDGGITEDIAPLCVTAGFESMVVGRGLLPIPAPGKED